MEYLQYLNKRECLDYSYMVLNLIINGIPSIREETKKLFEKLAEF